MSALNIQKHVRVNISVENTRCWMGLHTGLLLRFSRLFYALLSCFAFISAYFDLISLPVERLNVQKVDISVGNTRC